MIYLLTNDAGYYAETISNSTVAEGAATSVIAGPRASYYLSEVTSPAHVTYDTFLDPITSATALDDIAYAVIARADWLLTEDTSKIEIDYDSDGGPTWANLVTKNPIVASDLSGPYAQDFVTSFAATHMHGARVRRTDVGGAEAMKLSKFFLSKGFSFGGVEPTLTPPPVWQRLSGNQNFFQAPRATRAVPVEARLSLSWDGVSPANIELFKALPMIQSWPLFLYDPDQTIWDWKLEHVVIENFAETLNASDNKSITLNLLRLKHYP